MAAPTDILPASLVFLTDAAHLLAAVSPETSAHLVAQRNTLMSSTGLVVSDAQRQHACTACGHIMVPGHADVLRLDAHKAALRRRTKPRLVPSNSKKSSARNPSGRKRIECTMCASYTDIAIPPAPKITRRRPAPVPAVSTSVNHSSRVTATPAAATTLSNASSAIATVASIPLSNVVGGPPRASTNANSKKRAKSRKQGLQALLQQSRSSTPQSGLGLSLADFMKK